MIQLVRLCFPASIAGFFQRIEWASCRTNPIEPKWGALILWSKNNMRHRIFPVAEPAIAVARENAQEWINQRSTTTWTHEEVRHPKFSNNFWIKYNTLNCFENRKYDTLNLVWHFWTKHKKR